MPGEKPSANQGELSHSASSTDSVLEGPKVTHSPRAHAPRTQLEPPSIGGDGGRVMKASTADTILNIECNAEGKHDGASQNSSSGSSLQARSDVPTGKSAFASKHFFDEMASVGILGVEQGTFIGAAHRHADGRFGRDASGGVHSEAETSSRSSWRSRSNFEEIGKPLGQSGRTTFRQGLRNLNARVLGSERDCAARNWRDALSPPHNVRAPERFSSATNTSSKYVPRFSEIRAKRFQQEDLRRYSSGGHSYPTRRANSGGAAVRGPFMVPPMRYGRLSAADKSPISKFSSDPASNRRDESAQLRERCDTLEATVAQLKEQLERSLLAMKSRSKSRELQEWKEEVNIPLQTANNSAHQDDAHISSAENTDKSPITCAQSRCKDAQGSHSAASPRTVSSSMAPRSISPQSPKSEAMRAVVEECVEDALSPQGKDANPSPASFNMASLEKYVYRSQQRTQAAVHAKDDIPEPPEARGATSDTTDVHVNDHTTQSVGEDEDVLQFSEKGGCQQILHHESIKEPPQSDNLALVLAERQTRELTKDLLKTREEIGFLQENLERHRLRRDELETQVLAQEEQILLQKDQADQRAHELEEEIAKLRAASLSDIPTARVGGKESFRDRLQTVMDIFAMEVITEEERDTARQTLTEMMQLACSPENLIEAKPQTVMSLSTDVGTKLRGVVSSLASLSDPASSHGDVLAKVLGTDATFEQMVAAAQTYVKLAQEAADTQAIRLAELREELLVVRKDRNELLGQQSEQVRLLQEELLEKDTEQLHLMERGEGMREELKRLRAEVERAGQQPVLKESSTANADDAEREPLLREKHEQGKCETCAALETRLREQQAASEAAQRAQHNVFTERLSSVQEQLKNVRVVTGEERARYDSELQFLRKQLAATQVALEAKEVALSIALREDIRRDRGRAGGDAEEVSHEAEVPVGSPTVPRSSSTRGKDSEAFGPLTIGSDEQRSSASLSSQGVSGGESTGATRGGVSGSHPQSEPSAGRRSGEGGAKEEEPLLTGGALARLLRANSHDSESVGENARSPSPASTPVARQTEAERGRSAAEAARSGEDRTLALLLSRRPVFAGTTPMVQREEEERVPRRRAPVPTATPSPVAPTPRRRRSAGDEGGRRVRFMDSLPSTSSPPAPPPTAAVLSLPHREATGATGSHRDGPRSSSPSTGRSPASATGAQQHSAEDGDKESLRSLRLAPPREGDADAPAPLTPARAELAGRSLSPSPSPLLQERSGSAANASPSARSAQGKRRGFVKMGSLERMREVWVKQETLLLGSSPSS